MSEDVLKLKYEFYIKEIVDMPGNTKIIKCICGKQFYIKLDTLEFHNGFPLEVNVITDEILIAKIVHRMNKFMEHEKELFESNMNVLKSINERYI